MYELVDCNPIAVGCGNCINNIVFDGCNYYVTLKCQCEIIKLDKCFKVCKKYCTCREYDNICYDYYEHCFWASSRKSFNKIFKLDNNFNEIDFIIIKNMYDYDIITGISYDCEKNTLIVSLENIIIEIDKIIEKSKVIHTVKSGLITSVTSVSPALIVTIIINSKYYIRVIDCNGQVINSSVFNYGSMPKNIIFNPCDQQCDQFTLDVLAFKKEVYPYLYKFEITDNDLGFMPLECNFEICRECCSNNCCQRDPCADILESIALIEASISHILNAEGEKLQKIIAETDDIDKIICVNREVNKTIINCTHLEHILYAKLSQLYDCGNCGVSGDENITCNINYFENIFENFKR